MSVSNYSYGTIPPTPLKDIWYYENKITLWPTLPDIEKKEIEDIFLNPTKHNILNKYGFMRCVEALDVVWPKIKMVELIKNICTAPTSLPSYSLDTLYGLILKIKPSDTNDEIRTSLLDNSQPNIKKIILTYPNLKLAEEIEGLRCLSTSKYCPQIIYSSKYCPTFEALKALPPVGRMKIIDALLNNKDIAYNIFKNIPTEEDFKCLLFGSVLRHREKAEEICKKYKELIDIGNMGSIKIQGYCDNCGPFELTLTNGRIKTKTSLAYTPLNRGINEAYCMLCNRHLSNKLIIMENLSV